MTDTIDRLKAALADRYTIERELGAGGMATVYLAHDVKHNRKVAVKVLRPDLAAILGAERFLKEIEVTANLQHPHILPLFDSGEADCFLYYVMPYIEGDTLRDKLNREKQLSTDEAIAIARAAASALDYAHKRGLIHRDIKPENILLHDGQVLVADFGIALAVSQAGGARLTETGISLGTPEYMSPEQATGERALDARSDVYSLAAVVYEMLAGEPPHSGGTLQAIISKILTETPRSLREHRPRISSQIDDAIARALDRVPADRFSSAGEFVAAMEVATPARAAPANIGRAILITAAITAVVTATITGIVLRSGASPARPNAMVWERRPLTATGDARSVTLSPDGQTVAYLTSDGLVAQDVNGGSPNLVLRDTIWGSGAAAGTNVPGQPNGQPQWLRDGSSVAFTVHIDSMTLGISAVPRMGGDVTPQLVTTFTGGEVFANFQSLPGGGFLLARVLEPRQAAPWIRWMDGGSEVGIDVPQDIFDLWDAVAAPDGRWVAYIGERADGTNVVGTLSKDGTRHNVIAERGSELSKWPEISVAPEWAGNRIMRWPAGGRVYYRQLSTRGLDLYAQSIDLDSGEGVGDPELVLSGLPPGATFDVSEDETRIVYSGGVTRTQIRLFRFDPARGGVPIEERTMTQGTARHVAPRISPDGRRLAYVRQTGGSEDIYVVPIAGGTPQRVNVLYSWRRVIDIKWSSEGDRLAIFAETSQGRRFVIVSLSDARVRELDTDTPRGTWFDWSPDGRWIVFSHQSDEYYVLHEVSSGEERAILADLQGEQIQAMFSPDGMELVGNNIGLVSPGLWAAAIDGGTPRLVTAGTFGRNYPVLWSREGIIYVLGTNGTISTVDASGGTPRPFARIPVTCIWEGWASMSANGEYLACAVDEARESDVWVVDLVDREGGR